MSTEKFGFVYLWWNKNLNRYYIGSHWGTENDGYLCSSAAMREAHRRHPEYFKRRIIKRIYTNREDLLKEEQKWIDLIPRESFGIKYYNINAKIFPNIWWANEIARKNISQKLKGNRNGAVPCSPEKAKKISEAKLKKFQKKREAGLSCYSGQAAINIAKPKSKGMKHTDEWKLNNSKMLKEQWKNGTRNKTLLSQRMTENNPLHNPKIANKVSKALTGRVLSDIHKAKLIGKSRTKSQKNASKKCSNDLKNRWANPIWKANQIQRLKEGAAKRWAAEQLLVL